MILQTIKTTLNAKINYIKGEVPSITNLATTAALNAKINEVKGKIPDIINLANTIALIYLFIYSFILYLKLKLIKTDTNVCTIKNSYAAKDLLTYINCLIINFC